MTNATYTISMLGPSRVGKTSIIASVFDTAEKELLTGKPFKISTDGHKPTQKKLAQHARELRSSIQAGDFNSGAVAGTQEPFTFNFELSSSTDSNIRLGFEVLDFPGGWIDTVNRPDNVDVKWNECKNTITNSSVIIIPVEAGVIMNAKTKEQIRAIEYNLQTEDIKAIIKDWAKNRCAINANIPSTIIFVPVKGESYFKDNVNKHNKDLSKELYDRTQEYFKGVIETAQQEFGDNRNLSILYTAIDTIGSVTLQYGDWENEGDTLRFKGQYHITHPELQPKGGDDIFICICKTLVATQNYYENLKLDRAKGERNQKDQAAKEQRQYAESIGFFGWLFGIKSEERAKAAQKENLAQEAQKAYEAQAEKLSSILNLVNEIAKEELSPRTKTIV